MFITMTDCALAETLGMKRAPFNDPRSCPVGARILVKCGDTWWYWPINPKVILEMTGG